MTIDEQIRLLQDNDFEEIHREPDLEFNDQFVTKEQKLRDEKVTALLTKYVESYEKKVFHSSRCRYIILIPCIGIICLFSIVLIYLTLKIIRTNVSVAVTDLATFITASVSFVSLIVGLLTIVTKYFFPENDEKYITQIVESIQRNDLENKKENARNYSNNLK